jgi:hypothetical protein
MPTNAIMPPLSLIGDITNSIDLTYWNEDDGYGDPWLGMPYQWTLTVSLRGAQLHSSHRTKNYMYYDATDVNIGDWIADVYTGRAVKIIRIDEASTGTDLVCDVEDVDRFNTFSDYSQSGIGRPDSAVSIFSIGKDGLPVFGPLSQYSSLISNNAFAADVLSNFRYRNLLRDSYRVSQPGHSFVEGESVYLKEDGTFDKALGNLASSEKVIGTINTVGTPGAEWFTIRPLAPISSNLPQPLPGLPGDLIYLDPATPGAYTSIKPANFANAIFIKISDYTGMPVDRGISTPVSNYAATTTPSATDDSSSGYTPGSMWVNISTKTFYTCVDASVGSAVWTSGSGSSVGATSPLYKFVQDTESLLWDVVHNKNSVDFTYTLFDATGAPVWPDSINIVDENEVQFNFTQSMAGKVILSFL